MKIITLEEHFLSRFADDFTPDYFRKYTYATGVIRERLMDIGAGRIADMDANGIDMQVLSHTVPGPQEIEDSRRVNDELAEAVAKYPTRFAAFASLPMAHPENAAKELERAVTSLKFKGAMIHGTSNGKFLDDPSMSPVLAAAESLNVPIYLHPAPPPPEVAESYFSGLTPNLERMLTTPAWGWHAETALHVLRLIGSGTFDRFPGLQLIIGHMGEMLPFQIARTSKVLSRANLELRQEAAAYFNTNIWITTSGFFTHPPLELAIRVLGIDRILFSIDYPYSGNEIGKQFLDSIALPEPELQAFAHGNAERLLRLQS